MLIRVPHMGEIPVNGTLCRPVMIAQHMVMHGRAQKHLSYEQDHQPGYGRSAVATPGIQPVKVIQHGWEPVT